MKIFPHKVETPWKGLDYILIFKKSLVIKQQNGAFSSTIQRNQKD